MLRSTRARACLQGMILGCATGCATPNHLVVTGSLTVTDYAGRGRIVLAAHPRPEIMMYDEFGKSLVEVQLVHETLHAPGLGDGPVRMDARILLKEEGGQSASSIEILATRGHVGCLLRDSDGLVMIMLKEGVATVSSDRVAIMRSLGHGD